MDKALLVGLVFVAVGAGSVLLLWATNRDKLREIANAREELIRRAANADESDVQAFIKSSIDNEDSAKAEAVLAALAQVLTVPSAKLARDVEMADLFTLQSESSGRRLEPFAFDLVDKLHSACDGTAWDRFFQSDEGLPKNEDQLADFLMEMRVGQVLKVFAPVARRPPN